MCLHLGESVTDILKLIRKEADQDRVLGILYRMYVNGDAPDLQGESDAVKMALKMCFAEMERLLRRSARNARYYAATHPPSYLSSYKTGMDDNSPKEEQIQKISQLIPISPVLQDVLQDEKEKRKERETLPPTPPYKEKENKKERVLCSSGDERRQIFDRFWAEYPRKQAKKDAFNAFGALLNGTPAKKVDALMSTVMGSLAKFKRSYDWVKEDGKYIPYPATWLRQRRWEDEPFGPGEVDAKAEAEERTSKLARRMSL